MKTRRFDLNFRPLQLQISLAVDGGVPDTQNYNADKQEYTPDYSITPLIIQPNVSIIDKDEVLPSGRVNHKLTNVKWYENINGVSTIISTSGVNYDYEITTTGSEAGRIKVRKNVEPKIPLTLEFYAEYIDERNSQLNVIRGTYLISCSSAADIVRVELNAASQTIFNPLSDPDNQTVTATVWVADRVCESHKYMLIWELLGDDNTWHTVGSDEVLDYQVSISGNTATINRRLMGAEMYLRCRCKYSADSDPTVVALTDSTPQALVAFVRRIPMYEYDFTGVPVNIPAGLLAIAPEALIRTTNGEISNPDKELLPLWYIATNKASGSLSYSLVAHGLNPTIPTKMLDNNYGAVIGLDVVDRGYAGAFTDNTDSAVLCDGDGKVLII